MRRKAWLAGLLGLTVTAGVSAQSSAIVDRLERCGGIGDDVRRLACFDALAAELRPGRPEHDPALVQEESADAGDEAIAATIRRLEKRPFGEYVFHLSNGQVWTELEPGRARYRTGLEIRIESTVLGGHVLTTEAGRATRVRRLE